MSDSSRSVRLDSGRAVSRERKRTVQAVIRGATGEAAELSEEARHERA